MLTYGDGVADINIRKLLSFHLKHKKIATVSGVHPSSRFGELIIEGNRVRTFSEKPQTTGGFINGGYFVFSRRFFQYLDDSADCYMEREPLDNLAKDRELAVYQHEGFWQCMDTRREMDLLTKLWEEGNAPWKRW